MGQNGPLRLAARLVLAAAVAVRVVIARQAQQPLAQVVHMVGLAVAELSAEVVNKGRAVLVLKASSYFPTSRRKPSSKLPAVPSLPRPIG